MMIKMRGLLGHLLLFICFSAMAERYELIENHVDDSGNQSTLIYLDTWDQRVVIKDYQGRVITPLNRPESKISEAWISHAGRVSLERSSEIDLKEPGAQNELRSLLEGRFGVEKANSHFDKTLQRVRSGDSRYRLMQMGTRENTQVGVYYNDLLGEFIFQSMANKGAKAHNFARTVGLAADLDVDRNEQSQLVFERTKARTISQFDEAVKGIELSLNGHGFKLPTDAFNSERERVQHWQNGLNRLFVEEKQTGEFEEVLYHPLTNEVLVRRYRYNDSGIQVVIAEEILNLNDDIDYEAAYLRFQGMGEEGEEHFKNILLLSGGCLSPLEDVEPLSDSGSVLVSDMDKVLEKLWEQSLEGGLPETGTVSGESSFNFSIDLLGEKHTLVGDLSSQGHFIDLNFKNPMLARDKKMRIRHVVNDRGQKEFLVEAKNPVTDEWEAQLVLGTEFVRASDGSFIPKLAAYMKGKRGEGNLSFSAFEKSTYDLDIRNGKLRGIGNRLRFNGERSDPYQNLSFEREGAGGLINFAFQVFFSKDGRREKVRKTIEEEATKTFQDPQYRGFVDSNDVKRIAGEVTDAVALRTNNFEQSKNRVEAVATEEAYSRYGELVLQRMIATMMPDEPSDSLNEIADTVMNDFRLCLKRASDARNSEMANRCMEIFAKEAPASVGGQILQSKLVDAGLGDFVKAADSEYLACLQEQYDPQKMVIKSEEGISIVKSCIYKSLINTIDQVAPALVEKEVGKIGREMNLSLSYDKRKVQQSLGKVRSCMAKEGLAVHGPRGYSYNFNSLRNVDTGSFEVSFMGCANELVADISLDVAKVALQSNLNEVSELSEESKNRIASESFGPGMENCLEVQREVIRNARVRFDEEKRRAIASGVKVDDLKLETHVPNIDPLACNKVLTNYTVGKSTNEMIKTMLGTERFNDLTSLGKIEVERCFEKKHEDLLGNLGIHLLENQNYNESELARVKEERTSEAERATATCLKEAVAAASFYISQDLVLEKLAENPDYKDVSLSDALKEKIGDKIRACFSRGLSEASTVDAVLAAQDKLKDSCGAEMLADSEIQQDLFAPFIGLALSDVDMEDSVKEKVTNKLIAALGEKVKDSKSIDETMAIINDFNRAAVPLVLDEIVRAQVESIIKGDDVKSNEVVSTVHQLVFGANGDGPLGIELQAALESKDKNRIDSAVAAITKKAATVIGPDAIRAVGNEMLADGVLDYQSDVELLVEKGASILNECLENKVPDGVDIVDHCVAETTVGATKVILEKKLGEKVDTHPLLASVVTGEEKTAMIDHLVNANVEKRLREIASLPEGEDKDRAMDKFVLNFKVDATNHIYSEVIQDVVEEKLPTPAYFAEKDKVVLDQLREKIANDSRETMNNCVDEVKGMMRQEPEKVTELNLDFCMNKARLDATEGILPHRLGLVLNYLHGDNERIGGLVDSAMNEFKLCSAKKNVMNLSDTYGAHLDGCLNQSVLGFVGEIITDLRTKEPSLLSAEDAKADWSKCFSIIETAAKKKTYPSGAPNELNQLTGAELYAKLYEVGDSKTPKMSPDLDWLVPQIMDCGLGNTLPDLLLEFRGKFIERNQDELDPQTKEFALNLTQALHSVLTTKQRDGSVLNIDFMPLLGKASADAGGNEIEEGKTVSKPAPILEMILEFEPKVIEHLSMIAAYDPEGMNAAIENFEKTASERISSRTGKMPLNEAVGLISDTGLLDTTIEAMIATIVRDEATKALEAEGADTSIVWKLSSKEMINRLFGEGKGKGVVDKIKSEYLIPLMTGKLKDISLPADLMNEAKEILAEDTGKGGFVELLFGSIMQKKLDDQLNGLESGWFKYAKMSAAGWMGYNKNRHFYWGDEENSRNSRYQLRDTADGQKAVEYFAENLLKPTLRGTLSDEQKEEESEKIEDIIKDAMGAFGSNPVYDYFR